VRGRNRVEEVVVEDVLSGRLESIPVDTVVFTGDWIPDNEFVRRANVDLNPRTLGPACDSRGRRSVMSLYAAGNFIHPVETADVASLRARAVAHAIADDLQSPTTHTCLDIVADGRLASVWPNRVNFGTTTNSFALRSMTYHASRMVTARQDGVVLGTSPVARIVLNRSHSISGRMIESANKERGAIHFSLGA
jgi:hypothetical protein